ncbi:hypothetical protein LCGC14_1133620 [marine sediment metagenome]|uniref:Uncharacterized protein n=1 Tax=marine sediment metagenome TaxID=412755 RepID=A0A0F9M5C2_9ZZZZ
MFKKNRCGEIEIHVGESPKDDTVESKTTRIPGWVCGDIRKELLTQENEEIVDVLISNAPRKAGRRNLKK